MHQLELNSLISISNLRLGEDIVAGAISLLFKEDNIALSGLLKSHM